MSLATGNSAGIAPLELAEVCAALGADRPGAAAPLSFGGVSTDSRAVRPGDLFVALVGQNSDGHLHVRQAVESGAAAVVASRPLDTAAPVICVADTEVAYGRIGRVWRDRFRIPVIAVTGSVGKTTTKEMIAAALAPLGPVVKTEASQNTETGVPKTLLGLHAAHRAAVVEMGMRGPGQIATLCAIARPTIAVITLIGETHIEMLGSRDAIADAKAELLQDLPESGVAVLNADDTYLPRLRAKTAARVVTYGFNGEAGASTPFAVGEGGLGADFTATQVVATASGWAFQVAETSVEIHSVSRHDISNALAAIACAVQAGVSATEAAHALSLYRPIRMRMEVHKSSWDGVVLDDAYNASPTSVKSALHTLRSYPGRRRIAFLGDMKELGDTAIEMHRSLGDAIAEIGGLDALYTVGELAAHIPGAASAFPDSATAATYARSQFAPMAGDVILVKGSRSMAMEKVVTALLEQGATTGDRPLPE